MRREINLTAAKWSFTGRDGVTIPVRLPHTWNNLDGQDGGNDYYRGKCTYQLTFPKPDFDPENELVYVEFDGVNSSCAVTLNGVQAVTHDGGYSTFRANITELVAQENLMTVEVDNSPSDSVYPQKADFTFWGGIYRDVRLVIVSKNHLVMDYYGGKGVKITPRVTESGADVEVCAYYSGSLCQVTAVIRDAEGTAAGECTLEKAAHECSSVIHIDNPHLWNGKKDPYLYSCTVALSNPDTGEMLDQVTLRFGIRTIKVDPEKGFFLNGVSYPLHGVSRHQDRKNMGNAIGAKEHLEDLDMIMDIGANCIRLAHYQHSQIFYDRCDELGLVVWAEIPYISEHMPKGRSNTVSQMTELITQNYHHPCIICWGLSNEITISTKDKKDMLDNHRMLNDLVHKMDPTRYTSLACYAMCGPFNKVAHITDLVGWNLYLGWYVPGLFLNDLWISFFHLIYPKTPLSYSEYGCEAMPNLHSAHPHRGDHSEEYQCIYHEYMARCFAKRPYMWANFVWNMFDFAADARDQGGEPGMNHKGLVTYDRKLKKDAFYLYKAYWSDEPFIHICGKRMEERTGKKTKVKIYTNQPHIALFVDSKPFCEMDVDKVCEVKIPMGRKVTVKACAGNLSDTASFIHTDKPNPGYRLQKKKNQQKSNWVDAK